MPAFIEMPKLSDTMTEGTVVKWCKAVGDPVQLGDVVAEIETDKAVMELEAFGEGTLSEIYVQEGGKAAIGQKLARLGPAGGEKQPDKREFPTDLLASIRSADHPTPMNAPAPKPDAARTAAPPAPVAATPSSPAHLANTRVKASPLAKKIAAARGVDLTALQGSGPGGRVVARDVESFAAGRPAETQPPAAAPAKPVVQTAVAPPAEPEHPKPEVRSGDKRIPLSGMRQVIADRLLASKTQIPHFYLHIEVDAGELLHLRAQVNAAMEKAGWGKLTVNDFVLRAAVLAATQVPRVNAAFVGDAIIEYAHVHLSVAVAIEEGLVTPVIREAEKKSLREISQAVKDLADRARHKRLKPDEYQGGTLTVSNLGSYGIESFSAIINPPQAMVLAIGAITKKPVVSSAGEIIVGERMSVGLSADHRVVDGAVAAQYLTQLRQFLENPALLLI